MEQTTLEAGMLLTAVDPLPPKSLAIAINQSRSSLLTEPPYTLCAPPASVLVCLCNDVARLHVYLAHHAVVVGNCKERRRRQG